MLLESSKTISKAKVLNWRVIDMSMVSFCKNRIRNTQSLYAACSPLRQNAPHQPRFVSCQGLDIHCSFCRPIWGEKTKAVVVLLSTCRVP